MFMTQTELINARLTADARVNESDIIKYIIQEDLKSPQKRKMLEGEKYYVGEHDILKKDFTSTRISESKTGRQGEESETISVFRNPNRSNHRNVNPFHKILVDQKVSYIAGREAGICVRGAESNKGLQGYERMLSRFADEEFNETLQDLIAGASNSGYEVLHVYYDWDGKLRYCTIPARECIPIYDTAFERDLEQMIRYYDTVVIRDGKRFIRKKVEWWTKEDVTYYIENEENEFIPDCSYEHNPSPHWWSVTEINGIEKKREAHSWGRVPFIILKNNTKGTTDLEIIKGLIDAYDLISSEGTNNLLDLVDLYWVIAGYGGETASAVAKKLQINKAVSISDSSGSVEARQVELDMESRIAWLNMLRRDIFHFGQGVDVDVERFGTAPSGVSLKFQYTLLDLKANNLIAKLKRAIRELFFFVTADYNRKHGTDFDSRLIEITINKSMIANDKETVEMIGMSKDLLSPKTLMAKHPFVEDVNAEMEMGGRK